MPQRGTTVNVNKRYIPSLRPLQYSLPNHTGKLRLLEQKTVWRFLPNAPVPGGSEIMKLFRTAFWLGVVIYNLPNSGSQSAPPASQVHDGPHLLAKAANSRDAAQSSQDILTPRDRAVSWRGSARSRSASKQSS